MDAETSRLILRRPRLLDVTALFEFLGDAQAMQHTHVDASLRECRRRIAVHERRRRYNGYAPWTIMAKSDRQIIGWGGLYDDPFDPGWGVEVGYFFHPSAWGLGYASEMVAAYRQRDSAGWGGFRTFNSDGAAPSLVHTAPARRENGDGRWVPVRGRAVRHRRPTDKQRHLPLPDVPACRVRAPPAIFGCAFRRLSPPQGNPDRLHLITWCHPELLRSMRLATDLPPGRRAWRARRDDAEP